MYFTGREVIFEKQLLVRRRVHADLNSDKPCQLYEIITIFAVSGKTALNKHVFSYTAK